MPIFRQRGRPPYSNPVERARKLRNSIRLLAFVVAAMLLMVGIALEVYPPRYLPGVAALLAYPLLMQALAALINLRRDPPWRLAVVMMPLDAAVIGGVCAALHFALVPSLVLLIIVHADTMNRGGALPWLLNALMVTAGAGGAAVVLNVPLQAQAVPPALALVALLGLALHVTVSALYASQQAHGLRAAQVQVRQQQRQAMALSRKLAKYLPPQIWGSLFSGERDATLGTRRKRLTVFFSDIKGFSTISEELPLDTLTHMLNTYLSEMTRIALRHGGTIDKFIGDAVMVFFGDPQSDGAREDAHRAVAMAIEMQQYMKLLRQRWRREGIRQPLEIRIGINTGYVTVGNFGTDSRMDYTLLGTDVNLASRLESACRPGSVLISQSTHELVSDRVQCRSVGDIQVKGFNRPIPVFEALELKRHAGGKHRYVSVESNGFGLHLDLERVHHVDRNRILKALARTALALRKGKPATLDFQTEGFALFVKDADLRRSEHDRIIDVLARVARKVQSEVTP